MVGLHYSDDSDEVPNWPNRTRGALPDWFDRITSCHVKLAAFPRS